MSSSEDEFQKHSDHLTLDSVRFVELREAILVLLGEGVGSSNILTEKLRKFYLLWSSMSLEEKNRLEVYFSYYIPSDRLDGFRTLIGAFAIWDHIQEVEGAPGINSTREFGASSGSLYEEIALLLHTTETVWKRFVRESAVNRYGNCQH